jgi:hypothetical protein
MPHGSYSLGETAAKQKMVRLICHKCRRGRYRIDRLLEKYGPDIACRTYGMNWPNIHIGGT